MSQIYSSKTSGPVPPQVPTTFQTPNGNATPNNNIIIFNADQDRQNVDVGIADYGSGNTVTYKLQNRLTGTASTISNETTTLIRLNIDTLSANTDGTFYLYGNVVGYNSSNPASTTFDYKVGLRYKNNFPLNGTITVIGFSYHDTFQENVISDADLVFNVTGGVFNLRVTGSNGNPISWNGLMEYRRT